MKKSELGDIFAPEATFGFKLIDNGKVINYAMCEIDPKYLDDIKKEMKRMKLV